MRKHCPHSISKQTIQEVHNILSFLKSDWELRLIARQLSTINFKDWQTLQKEMGHILPLSEHGWEWWFPLKEGKEKSAIFLMVFYLPGTNVTDKLETSDRRRYCIHFQAFIPELGVHRTNWERGYRESCTASRADRCKWSAAVASEHKMHFPRPFPPKKQDPESAW